MTRRIGNTVILEDEPPAICELCGAFAELRPYGPNNERICFDCGMKNWETTERKMEEFAEGANVIIDIGDNQAVLISGELTEN